MRELIKTGAAVAATIFLPQARYHRMIIVLSHMRSASTALCNVLCSHPDISGYGETHVSHGQIAAPGRVAFNLVKHKSFRPRARFILDKVLHPHLDIDAYSKLSGARAIFLVRDPAPAVASICDLSVTQGMTATASHEAAAQYYAKRVNDLRHLWAYFPPHRRIGLRTETLLSNPEEAIATIGQWLQLKTPLVNSYEARPASTKGGGGDPSYSAFAQRIEVRETNQKSLSFRKVAPDLAGFCQAQHKGLLAEFGDRQG